MEATDDVLVLEDGKVLLNYKHPLVIAWWKEEYPMHDALKEIADARH